MTGKNLTHLRALYDLDQNLDERFPRTTYAIEHPGVFRWSQLNKGYMWGIKPRPTQFDAGVQTPDGLIMDNSDLSETIELLEDGGGRTALLLPNHAFRLLRRHFFSWKNRFLRQSAMNLRKLEQEMSPKPSKQDQTTEIERRICSLKYGTSVGGIRPVRFYEYTVTEKLT